MTVVAVDQERDLSCLGASEAAGVLGLDKYNPPISVWRRHRGMRVLDENEDNEAAYWGAVLEPVIRGKYALDRKAYVYVPRESTVIDAWLRSTPDGFVWEGRGPLVVDDEGGTSSGCDGLLQVKTCSAWLADDWQDGPPAKYEVQCRVEMAVCDLPWNDIVCLCGGQRQLGPFRIERDLAIEDRILTSLREFWSMVQDGTEPSPDHTDAWKLHVSEKMDRVMPNMIQADSSMELAIATWRERRATRVRSERAEGEIKNQIMDRLAKSGATRIEYGDGRITAYKAKGVWVLKSPSAWKEDR